MSELEKLRAKSEFFSKRLPEARVSRYAIRNDKGLPELIRCKGCSAVIQQNNHNTGAYRELKLLFDDKSAHVTHLCSTCLDKGLDLPALEKLYCADLLELSDEEEAAGILMDWRMLAYRRPVGFVRE